MYLYFHSWCSYTGARKLNTRWKGLSCHRGNGLETRRQLVGKGMPEAEILELIQVLVVTLRMSRVKMVQREREQIRKLGNILERHS